MKYVEVYGRDVTDYNAALGTGENNKLGWLENAKNVCITRSVNGDNQMTLTLPKGDPKWGIIADERQIGYNGEVFRIKEISGEDITALSLIQDACRTHVRIIEDMINQPVTDVIVPAIFSGCPYVNVLSAAELRRRGYEPVNVGFDFFAVSKKTPIGCLNLLTESLRKYKIKAEVYINNKDFGLVKTLGTRRTDVILDTRYNTAEVKSSKSTYELINRLYPYGKDDMPLGNATGYIESRESIAKYGLHEGFCNFDEITDPAALMSAAEAQFSPDNPERIDEPKYSLSIKAVMTEYHGAPLKPGDIITVRDKARNIETEQRIIKVEEYPFEPQKNSIEVGVPQLSMQEAFSGMFTAKEYLRLNKNGREELKTPTLEFMEKNEDVYLEGAEGERQKIAKYKTGALFVSPNEYYAVAIMDGKVKVGVRDTSKPDNYNWVGVFGQGKVYVNEIYTGTLNTNNVTVQSADRSLTIDDNLLTMVDGDVTKLKLGYDDTKGKYVFTLYNSKGEETFYADDDGNQTLRGILRTGKNGEARVVIDGNGIQSFNDKNQKHGLQTTVDNEMGRGLQLYSEDEKFLDLGLARPDDYVYFQVRNQEKMSFDTDHSTLIGTWRYKYSEIANQNDINDLKNSIAGLQSKVSEISDKLATLIPGT